MQKEAKLGLVVIAVLLALIVGLYFLVPPKSPAVADGRSSSGSTAGTTSGGSYSSTAVPASDPLTAASPAGSTTPPVTPPATRPSDPLSMSVGPTIVPPATTQRSPLDPIGGSYTPPTPAPSSTQPSSNPTPPSFPTPTTPSAGGDPWRTSLGVDSPGSSGSTTPPGSAGPRSGSTTPGSSLPPFGTRTSSTSDSSSSASMSSYTVVRGDTLSAIATKVYGNPNLWSKIAAANPGVDSSHLKIGQILKIPAKGEVAPPSSSSASSGTPSHEGVSGSSLVKDPRTEYQVVSGDSLHKIAQKLYGNANRWEEIYNLNKSTIGSSPTKLKIGMILKLPAPPTNTPSSSSPSTSPTR